MHCFIQLIHYIVNFIVKFFSFFPEISFQCKETFNKTLPDNLAVLLNYPRGVAEKYFHKLGVHKTIPDKMRTFPVFATAFDNKYFYRAQGLFKSIHEMFLGNRTDLHVIVYDLGMTSLQYTKVIIVIFYRIIFS
jgi:hypothetical protein